MACPWCFIGKRRLEKALARLPDSERPHVRWHAFQLMPEFPEGQSTPARAMLEKKFGGGARFAQMFEHLRRLGEAEGISFDLDKQVACNTGLAHRAVALARLHGRENAAVEAFFRAQFEEGRDLSQVDTVVAILVDTLAGTAAADAGALRETLEGGGGAAEVNADRAEARHIGVEGVPFFVLDEQIAMSGAQDPETFAAFLAEGRKRATV